MIPDAGDALKRALRRHFSRQGCAIEVESLASRPWASVTFSGARHSLDLVLEGAGAKRAAAAFLAGLDDREFELAGHFVADIAAMGDLHEESENRVRLTLEALTVEAD